MDTDALRVLADDLTHTVQNGYEVAPENFTRSLHAAADELDRLRAVIENAPHDSRCTIHPEPGYTPNCTCWKAKIP